MNTTKKIMAMVLATMVSCAALAETANPPNAEANNVAAAPAAPAAAPNAMVPTAQVAAPMTEPPDDASTTGWGCGGKQGRMEMMHKHMQKMETHLTNIESLLKQLVDENKK